MGKDKLQVIRGRVGYVTETAKQVLVHSAYAALSGLAEQAGLDTEPGFFRGQVFLARQRGNCLLVMDGGPADGGVAQDGDPRIAAFQVILAWAKAMSLDPGELSRYTPEGLAQEALVPYLIRTEGPDQDGEPGWLEHLAHSADPLNAGVHFSRRRRGKAIPDSLRAGLALEVKASAAAWLAILRDDELRAEPGSEAWQRACAVLEKGTGFDEELAQYRPKRRKAAKAEVAQVAATARVAIPAFEPEPEEAKALPPEPEATAKSAAEPEAPKAEAPEWAHKADRALFATARVLADIWRMVWSVFGWRDKRID